MKQQVLIKSKKLTSLIIESLQEIKGRDILMLDLRKVDSAVTDYFVICTGTSDRHVQALADKVIEEVHKHAEEKPLSQEGVQLGEWVLLDYVNVVVHIFQQEMRNFYRLEDLWGDAVFTEIEE